MKKAKEENVQMNEEFWAELYRMIKEKGYTIRGFSKKLGYCGRIITLRKSIGTMSLTLLENIATALNVSVVFRNGQWSWKS